MPRRVERARRGGEAGDGWWARGSWWRRRRAPRREMAARSILADWSRGQRRRRPCRQMTRVFRVRGPERFSRQMNGSAAASPNRGRGRSASLGLGHLQRHLLCRLLTVNCDYQSKIGSRRRLPSARAATASARCPRRRLDPRVGGKGFTIGGSPAALALACAFPPLLASARTRPRHRRSTRAEPAAAPPAPGWPHAAPCPRPSRADWRERSRPTVPLAPGRSHLP